MDIIRDEKICITYNKETPAELLSLSWTNVHNVFIGGKKVSDDAVITLGKLNGKLWFGFQDAKGNTFDFEVEDTSDGRTLYYQEIRGEKSWLVWPGIDSNLPLMHFALGTLEEDEQRRIALIPTDA